MRLKISVLYCTVLISLIYCVISEEKFADDIKIERGKPLDQLSSQKYQLYTQKDQQPLSSKLVKWIRPADNLTKKNRSFQYLTDRQSREEKDCNSCNCDPWIPITSPLTEKTAINFRFPINFLEKDPNYSNPLNIVQNVHPPPVSYRPSAVQHNSYLKPKNSEINYHVSVFPQFHSSQKYFPHFNKGYPFVTDYMVPPPVGYKSSHVPSKHVDIFLSKPHTKSAFIQTKPFHNSQLSHLKLNNKYWEQLVPQAEQFITVDMNTADAGLDSYGAPLVTEDSLNYFSPPKQLALSNEHKDYLERSIPLPNLSSFQTLPLRDYENFRNGFTHNRHNSYSNISNIIKIEKSVNIADYLATIEHPVTVIRSPLIELSISTDNFYENRKPHKKNNDNEIFHYKNTKIRKINSLNQEPRNPQTSTEQTVIYTALEETPILPAHISENSQNSNSDVKLSEFPIIVEDVYPAASSNNDTYTNYNEILIKRNKDGEIHRPNGNISYHLIPLNYRKNRPTGRNIIKELLLNRQMQIKTSNGRQNRSYERGTNLTTPTLDYSNWRPSYAVTIPSIRASLNLDGTFRYTNITRPKLLQIIVPYVNNKNTSYLEKERLNKSQPYFPQTISYQDAYTTVMTPPETGRFSIWSNFKELPEIPKTTTTLFDIVSLQNHIDNWTQQTFSQNTQKERETSTRKENRIGYLPSGSEQLPYNFSGSNKKITKSEDDDLVTNLIIPTETIEKAITTTKNSQTKRPSKTNRNLSGTSHLTATVAPRSKQKVYVVTTQTYSDHTSTPATAWSSAPRIKNGQANNSSIYESYRFSVRVEPQNRSTTEDLKSYSKGAVKIVYSAWPHLVNNLLTTANKPFAKHPLFGFMSTTDYTINSNSTLKTILGGSRVTHPSSTSLPETEANNTEFNTAFSSIN